VSHAPRSLKTAAYPRINTSPATTANHHPMKAVVIFLAVLSAAITASGQGLLAIGQKSDYKENIPLTLSVDVLGGYDHINYKDPSNSNPNVDSFFMQGGVGLNYQQNDHTTKFMSTASFDVLHYFSPAENGKETFYNARVNLAV
jgi:hypothetical protein